MLKRLCRFFSSFFSLLVPVQYNKQRDGSMVISVSLKMLKTPFQHGLMMEDIISLFKGKRGERKKKKKEFERTISSSS